MPLSAVPAASESVQDVEWSDSDGEGSKEASGDELLDHDPELNAHSHSSLASEDAAENQEAEADHDTFNSWGSKDDGSEFGETGSGDLRVTAGETDETKKPKTKGEGDEEASSILSDSDAPEGDKGGEPDEIDGKTNPETETKDVEDEGATDLAEVPEVVATTEPGAGVGDLEVDALLTSGDDPPETKASPEGDVMPSARRTVINEAANEETLVDADLEPMEDEDTEAKDMTGDLSLRSKMRRKVSKSKSRLMDAQTGLQDRHPIKCLCVKCGCLMVALPIIIVLLIFQILRCLCKQLFRCCHCAEEEKEEEEEEKVQEVVVNRGPDRSRLKKKTLYEVPDKRPGSDIDLEAIAGANDGMSPMSSPRSPRSPNSSGRKSYRATTKVIKSQQNKPWKKERPKAKGASMLDDDVEIKPKVKEVKAAWWTHRRVLLHPEKLPGYLRSRYHRRKKWFRKVGLILDKIEEEESFDWENVDDDGNPAPVSFWCPRKLRRRFRFFMLVYWDPLLDLLNQLPEFYVFAKWFLRFVPFVGFLMALGWFSLSLYNNLQYKEGLCTVEKLPEKYETVGMIIEEVEAMYTVRRYFKATPGRPKGSKVQECKASVACGEMDYANSNADEKARCVGFESWELGDNIECYYHKDDYWGDNNQELFCLYLPSKLERESFTLGVSFLLLCLTCFIVGVVTWRKNDLKHQTELAQKESERQAQEAAAAKKRIEEKELEDAKKRSREARQVEGIDETDENVGDFELADDT